MVYRKDFENEEDFLEALCDYYAGCVSIGRGWTFSEHYLKNAVECHRVAIAMVKAKLKREEFNGKNK